MAMIKCPGCGAEISDESKKCIKCNYILDTEIKTKDKIQKKRFFIFGIVALIVVFVILFILLKSIFLKVNINMDFLEAGDIVNISNIIEPKYSFVSLENADSIVNTQVIGEVSIPYTLRCFGVSINKVLTLEVVDTKSPIIKGPDSLSTSDISDVNWGELYTVDDFTPNLEEKIKTEGNISKSEGIYDLVLTVEDSSGNIGEKQIKVEILKPTKDEKMIMKFIDLLVDKRGYKKDDITKLRMFSADDKSYYFFEVNGKDIYYYEMENNYLFTFDEAALIAGYYDKRSSYKLALKTMLKDVDMVRIQKLMQ